MPTPRSGYVTISRSRCPRQKTFRQALDFAVGPEAPSAAVVTADAYGQGAVGGFGIYGNTQGARVGWLSVRVVDGRTLALAAAWWPGGARPESLVKGPGVSCLTKSEALIAIRSYAAAHSLETS